MGLLAHMAMLELHSLNGLPVQPVSDQLIMVSCSWHKKKSPHLSYSLFAGQSIRKRLATKKQNKKTHLAIQLLKFNS
jgi:hypothetical protein